MINYAFVGFSESFDEPFELGFDHAETYSRLAERLRDNGLSILDREPEFKGFVYEKTPGHYEVLDRHEAFIKAKCFRQLKDESDKSECLQSYNVKYEKPSSLIDLVHMKDNALEKYIELQKNKKV